MCAHCLLSFHQIPLRPLSRFPWIFNLIFEQDGKIGWQEHHEAERKEMQCPALWGGITRTHEGPTCSSVEENLRALPDPELNPSSCCGPACPGLVRFRDGSLPSALRRPRPAHRVQLWAPHYHGQYSELQRPRRDWASPLRIGWGGWHCCLLKGRLGGVINVEQCLPSGGVKTDPGSSH